MQSNDPFVIARRARCEADKARLEARDARRQLRIIKHRRIVERCVWIIAVISIFAAALPYMK